MEEIFYKMNISNHFAVLGQETWRSGEEQMVHDEGLGVFIGEGLPPAPGRGSCGVGIFLSSRVKIGWNRAGNPIFGGYDGRVLGVRVLASTPNGENCGLHVISAYAPTSSSPQDSWTRFFQSLEHCIGLKNPNDILVIGIDDNSSLGTRSDSVRDGRDDGSLRK